MNAKSFSQKNDNTKIIGNPCYQIWSAMDYQMEFNNQNPSDKLNTKLLLMLPLVPESQMAKVKLNHLRLFATDDQKSSKAASVKALHGEKPSPYGSVKEGSEMSLNLPDLK